MNLLKQLKNLLKIPGNRVVLVEEGEPAYVICPIEDYLRLAQGKNLATVKEEAEPSDVKTPEDEEDFDTSAWMQEVNKTLEEVAEKEAEKEASLAEKEPEGEPAPFAEDTEDEEELKIEDLPF